MGTLASGSIDLNSLQVAGKPNKYITKINDTGITIHPEDTINNKRNILINSNGISIRNDALPMMELDNDSLDFNVINTTNQTYTNVATFGAISRIGKEASSHVKIASDGLYLYDNINLVSYFTDNSFKVANMSSNGRVWSVYATGNINWDSDYTPFLLTRFKETDVEDIIYYIPKTVSGPLTSGGSLNVDLFSLKDAGLLWESMVTRAYTGARVKYAWDSNGNQIEYLEGFTYSFTNTSSICRLTINYTNSSGNSALDTLTKLSLQIPSYQQYPCLMVGGYADTSDWKDASTNGGGIRNSQWAPYPFIVGNGITKEVYDEENNSREFEYKPSNAFTVDWKGNIKSAGTLTMENHSDPIGWFYPISDTISKLTGTSFASISGSAYTPSAGRYLITASARYSGASSGNRGVCIYQGGSVVDSTQVLVPAIQSSSWSTDLKTIGYFNVDGSTEFKIGLLQNSGSSLSTTYTLTFIRIR